MTVCKREYNTRKFLIITFVEMFAMCIALVGIVLYYTQKYNDATVNTVGDIYMEEMSAQLTNHFDTIIGFKMDQLHSAVAEYDPETTDLTDQTMLASLQSYAALRSFDHMTLCRSDGTLLPIVGEQLTLSYPRYLLQSIDKGEEKVASATNAAGEKWLLFGIPAKYILPDGSGESVAILASMPLDYINDSMSLYASEALTYSHIIQRDGTYVVKNNTPNNIDTGDNFFNRFREQTLPQGGKSTQELADELKATLADPDKGVYSAMLNAIDGRRHIYCSPLPHTEWYLVTVMPYSTLDQNVLELATKRTITTVLILSVLLANLIIIYQMYFSMSRKQMQRLEAARNEAEHANMAKSEFLSNMSHDIRTPMNGIAGLTAIAIANKDNPAMVQDCLNKISRSSKQLLGLINDVLDMSRIESGKMTLHTTAVSLRETIDSLVNIIQPQIKTKKQHLHVTVRDIIAETVMCDGVRLNQVLLNILSNANKYTQDNGTISVGMSQAPSPKGENYVRTFFSVKDNGIGMSREFVDKIFNSFVREDNARVNKTEGTGLGMAITKYIVDAMGGTIDIESQPGKGSEFIVTADFPTVNENSAEMKLPPCTILLADNDTDFCDAARDTLLSLGARADVTYSGKDAISAAKKLHGEGRQYDIALIDWHMPNMNGVETAKMLRETSGCRHILLMSAADRSDMEEDAKNEDISGFIAKPLFRSTLYYGLLPFLQENTQAEQHDEQERLKGVKVLLAEDNDLNWEIAYELLSASGLEIERAENGKICVDKFNASPAGYYRAILMDLRMPEMNGYEATEAIRKGGRDDCDVPIIAMTADAFAEDIQKCRDYGMNAHIAKPIDTAEVLRCIEKLIFK